MSTPSHDFKGLQARLGYEFKDPDLLLTALTHASYGDGRREHPNNERLEFLGDRVLGLLTAEMLYRSGQSNEGSMARRLNALVKKETCADIAKKIKLDESLRMSRAEEKQRGRDKVSILGDGCEALLAAIYLDGGLKAARAFYETFWSGHIKSVLDQSTKDPKTDLQEQVSSKKLQPPAYEVVEQTGPDHRPNFIIKVSVKGLGFATGEGSSKKVAERAAALALLESLAS